MSNYTNGPWLYRGKSDSVHESDSEYPYGSQIFQFRDEFAPSDEDLALILAAPDLIVALEAMCEEFRGHDLPYGSAAYRLANIALNKAKKL